MSYYVKRTFKGGITSCGGPYTAEQDARYMAAHLAPANADGVAVINERQDPVPTEDRPLLLRSEHRGFPTLRVVIGPFASREHVAQFVGAMFGASFRGLPMTAPTDWHLVQVDSDGDEHAWP